MLNKEVTILAVCEAISKDGMTIRVACDFVGVSYETIRRWKEASPAIDSMLNRARAQYAKRLLPLAEAKEPWKMLKSLYKEEYTEDSPQTNVQVNIDNRPLIAVPTTDLLDALKQLKEKAKVIDEPAKSDK